MPATVWMRSSCFGGQYHFEISVCEREREIEREPGQNLHCRALSSPLPRVNITGVWTSCCRLGATIKTEKIQTYHDSCPSWFAAASAMVVRAESPGQINNLITGSKSIRISPLYINRHRCCRIMMVIHEPMLLSFSFRIHCHADVGGGETKMEFSISSFVSSGSSVCQYFYAFIEILSQVWS